jgi:hypothetical protein
MEDAVVMNVVYYGQKTNKAAHNLLVWMETWEKFEIT